MSKKNISKKLRIALAVDILQLKIFELVCFFAPVLALLGLDQIFLFQFEHVLACIPVAVITGAWLACEVKDLEKCFLACKKAKLKQVLKQL